MFIVVLFLIAKGWKQLYIKRTKSGESRDIPMMYYYRTRKRNEIWSHTAMGRPQQ